MRSLFLGIFALLLSCASFADNFSLPSSQQPGPMISFGENIINKNQTQLFFFADDIAGANKHSIDLIPSILYGITDKLSIFLNVPYAASYQQGTNHSTGFEDAFVQLEYAFYSRGTAEFFDQATIVGNMTFPTGSIQKNPPTGAGSESFFLGGTFNRTYSNWFGFTSYGAVMNTMRDHIRDGNQYLYQVGLGRNILSLNDWIFAWMIEGNGTYSAKDRIDGAFDPNSGGNVFYLTPSLWISSKKLILQIGVGLPVTQNLYGNQSKNTYLLAANLGWTMG